LTHTVGYMGDGFYRSIIIWRDYGIVPTGAGLPSLNGGGAAAAVPP